MGIVILVFVVLLPSVMKNTLYMSLVVAALAYLGYLFMGNKDKGQFFLSFIGIYLLALLAGYIAGISKIKASG